MLGLVSLIVLSCGRNTIYPNDKKTKYIFINQTNEKANLIGLKNYSIVQEIIVNDSSSAEYEIITPKTFASEEAMFNNPDSFFIRFEKINKNTYFTIDQIDFAHKSAMDPNAYSRKKIREDYLEKTYYITQEILDSAK